MCLWKYSVKMYVHSVRLYTLYAQNVEKLHTVGDAYGFLRVKSIWTYTVRALWDVLFLFFLFSGPSWLRSPTPTTQSGIMLYIEDSEALKKQQLQKILWYSHQPCLQPLLLSPTNSMRTNFICCHLLQRVSLGIDFCPWYGVLRIHLSYFLRWRLRRKLEPVAPWALSPAPSLRRVEYFKFSNNKIQNYYSGFSLTDRSLEGSIDRR